MSKHNATPALTEKHNAPEHHRVKPQEFHRAFHELSGHCYCTKCGAIGFQKHWYIDAAQEQKLRLDKNARTAMCPGCTRAEQELYEGEIVLANSKAETLMGDIVALIKHTEGRCWHKNPLAKIVAVTDDNEVLRIFTTTRGLAERVGKELHKTFKGSLEMKRSPGERFVRVYWTD